MYRNSEHYADPTAGRALAHRSAQKRQKFSCVEACSAQADTGKDEMPEETASQA